MCLNQCSGSGDIESSMLKDRKRGASRGLSLEKRQKRVNKEYDIHFPKGKWGVVVRDSFVFTMEMGVIVRTKAYLNKHLWKDMTDADKKPMFVHLPLSNWGLFNMLVNFHVNHLCYLLPFQCYVVV